MVSASPTAAAGIISRIRLENFMCHSSLQIEFADWVNFITGQNGSGKSAILTALCVAFGCRARGTQRAATLKDFIKTGCSFAVIAVEIKNQGEDAFKHDVYGNLIILERRITETTTTTVLKDYQGKKIAHRKEDIRELVEHFNIDVENPCVIMTQDKSRDFLHSGSDKDKFKFFFKATLLQQVRDLLQDIKDQLSKADSIVNDLEKSIEPVLKELDELQEKIKSMEHVEEISQQLQILKKKLAWCWVYDVDKQIEQHLSKLEKLKGRIPACQERIDQNSAALEDLNRALMEKKAHIASLMQKTSEIRQKQEELQNELSLATEARLELEEEHSRGENVMNKLYCRLKSMERQIHDIQEQHMQETQAEECALEERLSEKEHELDSAHATITRLLDEEKLLAESLSVVTRSMNEIVRKIEADEKRYYDLSSQEHELQQRQSNKVTTFGGERVLNLLRSIERHHKKFGKPPIGPIGAHVKLIDAEVWSVAVDCAIGKLLDAFIVTDHKDSLVLRNCSKEANYHNLQIIIYDFSRPQLRIPKHSLPSTNHPTTLSVIQSDVHTVFNVLVDMGGAERQVLVQDYDVGKSVAFEQRIQNLKEVYTSDGTRMFYRGSVQTTLPPQRRCRAGRLCGSLDDQINAIQREGTAIQEDLKESRLKKRSFDNEHQDLESKLRSLKKRRIDEERIVMSKQMELQDMRRALAIESSREPPPNVEEINDEISQVQENIETRQLVLEKIKVKISMAEEKVKNLKIAFRSLSDSAKDDIEAIDTAERELVVVEDKIRKSEEEKSHYEDVMKRKVLPDIERAEKEHLELQDSRLESFKKASIICSEEEMESTGGCAGFTPEQLSAQINRLTQRLQKESSRFPESMEDLRAKYNKKEQKVFKKKHMYAAFREKLNACEVALETRWRKFQRNATLVKRQLTWQFNGHLRRKGISGHIIVDYDKQNLSLEVKMPHDVSGNSVRDTRGLSGGERSFSTLCFALALHEMTESPFRAMDEFDVFMDAISRKISLDTLVEFAVAQGSQWIFITPHDISMVQPGERVKKQQMAAPRS